MQKFVRYGLAIPLLAFCVYVVGGTTLLMVIPSLFASNAEDLRLIKLGTIAIFTEWEGFVGYLDMVWLPAVCGVLGYLLVKPPRSFLVRVENACREAKADAPFSRRAIARQSVSSGKAKSWLGRGAMIVGGLILVQAWFSDVTVESGYGRRIVNLGLIADRQNELLLGCFIFAVGLVLFLFAAKNE